MTDNKLLENRSALLTGATGFLGSFILNQLLEEGCALTLIGRPAGEISAERRIARILTWFGKNMLEYPQLKVVEGYLDQERFGLPGKEYRRLLGSCAGVIHCASSTDFAEKNRSLLERTNIGALNQVLKFARSAQIKYFQYVSTAYACGRGNQTCFEELHQPEDFYNVYEETKNRAEHLVSDQCRSEGIPFSICRPSVVYGESTTGRSRRFNALYYPVKSLAYLKQVMLRDIQLRGGKRSAEMGVHLNSQGKLVMPIRVQYTPGSRIDLIPVNYFTEMMIQIFKNELEGIFHITSESPSNLQQLAKFTQRYLEVEGVVLGPDEVQNPTPIEKLFYSYIHMYLPYMEDLRKFDRTHTQHPAFDSIHCPPMDYPIFKRCMDYAIRTEWGKKIDEPE